MAASAASPGREPPPTFVSVLVDDGVRAAARRSPDKVALADGPRELTYRELIERIDRIRTGSATGLSLAPGEHAAIFSPNCLEFIEIVCGLAGAGVVPALVNSRSTTEELRFICDDSAARVLFVHPSLEETARAATFDTVREIIVLGDQYDRWLQAACPATEPSAAREWDPFSIPYTAGTTGLPKGVLLSHRSRSLTFFAMAAEFGCYGVDDRALALAPLYHGAGFCFALAPLFFGGFCEIHARFDPEAVLVALRDKRLTNVFMVPSHFRAIFDLGRDVLGGPRPSALKTIISNAAPLPQAMKEVIVDYFGEGVLFECYGSTEGGIVSDLRPADQLRKQACVGLPFPTTLVRLLDDSGREVPAGEVGELHSRSPFTFNGYWNRPGETEAAIHDGWCSVGDLARRDEEGYLYIVDRKDDMIVSGGVNIYPREIEEAMARHAAVAEVAVFGAPDDRWGQAVHAAVVVRPGTTVADHELLAACEHLARYKRPKAIRIVDTLPRNAAGKVLRRRLRGDQTVARPAGGGA
jgi:acyl-CoA synthetase (AMP-forming)/AMP-acid ligase II